MNLAQTAIHLGEAFPWPDSMSTAVIDRLVEQTRRKLASSNNLSDAGFSRASSAFPIAINTADANAQHYEIPADFFELILGPQRKYSCCLYTNDDSSLAAA